jgi:hypothetical protein
MESNLSQEGMPSIARSESKASPEVVESDALHADSADYNHDGEQQESSGASLAGHAVTAGVGDVLRRLSQHLGRWPVEVTAGFVEILDSTSRRTVARAYGSKMELLPTDVTGPGFSKEMRLIDCDQLVGSSARDRLVVQRLRLRYASGLVGDGPLTVHDLVQAYMEESRFLSGPEDMREYWRSRSSALADLLGFSDPGRMPDSSDVISFGMASDMVESIQQSMHSARSPLANYLEAPAGLVDVTRPHGQASVSSKNGGSSRAEQ